MIDYGKTRNNLLKMLVVLILLLLLTLIPLYTILIESDIHIVNSNSGNGELKSISLTSNELKQDIYLQGEIKNLTLYFLNENTDPKNNDFIEVVITQEKTSMSYNIPVNKIISNEAYTIDIKDPRFPVGNASISLRLMSDITSDYIYVLATKDLTSGLPALRTTNPETEDSILFLQYQLNKYSTLSAIRLALLVILFCILIAISYIYVYKSHKLNSYILYIASFSIIILCVCIRQPVSSFVGEPFSEAAYDFWYTSQNKGFIENIFTLEAGLYLSVMQRIVTQVAVFLLPNAKYVFVLIQLIHVFIVAAMCSMLCLKEYNKYGNPLLRLMISIFLGVNLFNMHSMIFHLLGYWGIVFIGLFLLMDKRRLSTYSYIVSCILGILWCFSKMYYCLFVPVLIIALILGHKLYTKRDKIFIYCIMLASTSQVLYSCIRTFSTINSRGGVGSIRFLGIGRFIENVFYYEVQLINTFFTQRINNLPFLSNITILIILIAIISFIIYCYVKKLEYRKYCIFMGSLILMTFANIALNIITSAESGVEMSAKVNWNANILLNAPQHYYIFSYFSIFLFIIASIYAISRFCKHKLLAGVLVNPLLTVIIVLSAIRFTPGYSEYYNTTELCPTEWQKVWQVTEQDSYYIPINTGYPHAGISLAHNSMSLLLAYDLQEQWRQIAHGEYFMEHKTYNKAIIGIHDNLINRPLLSISTQKANTNFDTYYTAIVYDKNHNELARQQQANSPDRLWIDFMFDKPIYGAYEVEFIHSLDGSIAYVKNMLNIGVSTIYDKSILKDKVYDKNTSLYQKITSLPKYDIDTSISVEYCNNNVICGLDEIFIDTKSDVLHFSGWAIDTINTQPASKVYINTGNYIYSGIYNIERSDVADALNNDIWKNCGFSIFVPTDDIIKNNIKFLEFTIVNPDESMQYQTFKIKLLYETD